jgi:RNA polymerase sigma-70 factor, ECF subfamily
METNELALSMTDCPQDSGGGNADAAILQRARAGDSAAVDVIVAAHYRRILRTTLHLLGGSEDAEDAAQEVFLRLFRYQHRFDPKRSLAPWLYRMAVNVCHDFRRARAKGNAIPVQAVNPERGDSRPDAGLLASERRHIVEMALETLTEKERAAIVLRDIEDLSTKEVARILGTRQTTVRSQISTGRVKIKKFVERFEKGSS